MPGELTEVEDFGGVLNNDWVVEAGGVLIADWEEGEFGFPDGAVQSVIELPDGRTGTVFSATGDRDYVRRFKVKIYPEYNIGPVQAAQAACYYFGIEPYGPYLTAWGDVDQLAVVTNVHAAVEDGTDGISWVVTVTYATQVGEIWPYADAGWPDDPAAGVNHPEREPPAVEWDFETEQQAMDFDLDVKPFVNSAQTPFVPVPTFPFPYPALTINYNSLGFNVDDAGLYAYAVNNDDFLGWPPGTALMFPWRARAVNRGVLRYYRVGVRIKFNPNADENGDPLTWQPQLLDAGFYELRPKNGGAFLMPPDPDDGWEPVPILGSNHMMPPSPQLLNGTGQKAKPEASGTFKGKILPVRLPFRVYAEMPFNELFFDIADFLG